MKLTLLISLLACWSFGVTAQQPDCAKFTTGRFGYPDLPGKISLRKADTQESYNNGVLEMLWTVRWIDECRYELTLKKVYSKDYPMFHKGDRILCEIVATEDDCFTTRTTLFNAQFPAGLVSDKPATMCIVKE
jgi:hypothetical protein